MDSHTIEVYDIEKKKHFLLVPLRDTVRAFGENKRCFNSWKYSDGINVINMSLPHLAKDKGNGSSLLIAVIMMNKIFI